ncbi:TPA: hypothetical protein ACH3X2_002670 [Trebouxia sp. C0005]
MAAAASHTLGSKVWVNDAVEGWVKGDVVKVEKGSLKVSTEKGSIKAYKPEECPLQNPQTAGGVEDMTTLSYLNEPGVLWNLKARYQLDGIYTYTGSILIAVNPFASLPLLYGQHMMEQYKGRPLGELSPHVYAIADAAFKQMRKDNKSQSILVSGESGAGKTETSKLIMKYLAWMGNGGAEEGAPGVEQQVLESNPLLEAFGNAKTIRNDNSSRFGKFVELQFNKAGRISGAAVRTYLLERSRVVQLTDPERNYHIFYQLCDGATAAEKERWSLKAPQEFHYLNQSSCYNLPRVSNAEEYRHTRRAMTNVGIPGGEQDAVFQLVATVLHLGNLEFTEAGEHDSSQVVESSAAALEAAARLLGVQSDSLSRALTTRTRHTVDGPIVSPIDVKAALDNRDSLAKTIYSRMFDWLVAKINTAIGQDDTAPTLVGVLDIYGFECFKENDFEQFCINLANEKLQQHFNQHVFKMEQAEYEREAIDWSYIEFVDNQDVLDLIEKRLGILDLLDEQCRFPKATNVDFANRLYSSPEVTSSTRFSKPKLSQTGFAVEHYAGGVGYKTDNFLVKNKDFVVAEHQQLMQSSDQPFVRMLFPVEPEAVADGGKGGRGKVGQGYKFSSVGSRFKKQLSELMEALHRMEPHYIRCIKPNSQNKPLQFENTNVLHQLRCGGVLEAVRISCAGFPTKTLYEDFVDHFWNLVPELLTADHDLDDKALSKAVLKKANLQGYQCGETKVFLRGGQMAVLDTMRTDIMHKAAVTIQRHARGFVVRRQVHRVIRAVIKIQAGARGMLARADARRERRLQAAITIQRNMRMLKARSRFITTKTATLVIQSAWRGHVARSIAMDIRQQRAALCIQRNWRRYQARKVYLLYRRRVVRLQCAWRSKLARRELRQRRASQREAGKLLQDKKALEDRLKEVQNILETVQNQRNELRQQYKEEKTARESLEAQLSAAHQQGAGDLAAEKENAQQHIAQLEARQQAADTALQEARQTAQTNLDNANAVKARLQSELITAQQKTASLQKERSEVESKATAVREDLMNRLNNALKQRDAAREEALLSKEELKKLQEDVESGALVPRSAVTAAEAAAALAATQAASSAASSAAAAAAAATPSVSAPHAQDPGMIAQARRYISTATPSTPPHPPLHPEANGDGHSTMALSMRPTPSPGVVRRLSENGALSPADSLTPAASGTLDGMSDVDRKQRELYTRQQQLLREQRTADQEKLLATISDDLSFHHGRPVAAVLIFRSCLQWKVFQADRTVLFDKIINTMGSQIERQQDNNACLSYWLSNTVTLLYLLQRNIKPASGGSYNSRLRASPQQSRGFFGGSKGTFTSFFSRTGHSAGASPGGDASIHGGAAGHFRQVEAKYPALLFKQQLDAFVQKIFPMLRDNVKKEITPQLAACIHAPRQATARNRRTRDLGSVLSGDGPSTPGGSNATQLSPHWRNILDVFQALLATLRQNYVPPFLVRKLFQQLFSFVNVQLFNQLLLRRECCSFSNGEYVKTGLAEVENWIHSAGKDWTGESWDELRYIRQAVTFLVIHQKHKKSLEEITNDLCPVLSVQQLYRISTMYWDDRYGTETVSHEVLGRMKQLMVDNNTAASHSFLLDDDSSIPFSLDDISNLMEDKDMYSEIPVPKSLKDSRNFDFLQRDIRRTSLASDG